MLTQIRSLTQDGEEQAVIEEEEEEDDILLVWFKKITHNALEENIILFDLYLSIFLFIEL